MTMDLDKLKADINKAAEDGEDFGCECKACHLDPKGLLDRGDCIPVMYGSEEKGYKCFRCLEDEEAHG